MTTGTEYVFPLSFAQQRLWFLDRIAPANPFYNIPLAVPIASYLDIAVLERALNVVISRHETLRTVFQEIDGEPMQIVRDSMPLRVDVVELTKLTPAEREARTLELVTAEAIKPFVLAKGPLVRCVVLRRGLVDHVLLLTMHHIVSDGWSMGILAHELTALYQCFLLGQPDMLPELPIQYADYAVWQREMFSGDALDPQLSYWRHQLRDLPVLALSADRPRPQAASFRGASHPVALSRAASAAVRAIGKRVNATPFMTLLAAFAALLARRTGQEDIVIGIPVAGRTHPDVEGLIGFFVNSLVVRVDASGDPPFVELLERVRDTALDAYANQDVPFERLVEELNPSRDPSRNPLFQITFQLVNAPTLRHGRGSGRDSGLNAHRGTAIFDLAFTLLDAPDAYRGIIEYSTDLFDADTIARLDEAFADLLEAALSAPETRLSRLPAAAAAERRLVAAARSGPRRPQPQSASFVLDAIAAHAERAPAAVAVEIEDQCLTYGELVPAARRLASHLRNLGAAAETRVGLLLDRSIGQIVAQLAALEAGAAYLPLDTSYPREALRFMAADAAVEILVTESAHERAALEIAPASAKVIVLDDGAARRRIDRCRPLAGPGPASPQSLCYIIYTSGSTGRPRGVGATHGALANHMQWMLAEFGFDSASRVLQRTAASFDASVWEIYAPLMSGGRCVLLPSEAQRDPERIVRTIARHGVTTLQVVPSLLRLLLEEPAFYTCESLQQIFSGGEPLGEDLRARVAEGLGRDIVNLYGPTETTIQAMFHRTNGEAEPFGVSIGRPIDNVDVHVLDGRLNPTGIGVTGEIYLGGEALTRGYLGHPAATAASFLPNPFSAVPGARMYRTRDLGTRAADGTVRYQGRNDDQVKLRGFRIELGEVEARIRGVPGVRDCAVFASGSDGGGALAAAIVPDDVAAVPESDRQLVDTHVEQWRRVYEQVYGQLSAEDSAEFNPIGWVSSYSGDDIEHDDMRAWRDSTVARIRELEPRRVLEIGCGTGLLLCQLAPDCERYVGTDFSKPVIEDLRRQLGTLALSNVELLERRADDFRELEAESFDTIVLNSVAQYFPSPDYLAHVIDRAVGLLSPGGALFLGDLRSFSWLGAFHLSLATARVDADAPGHELLKQMRKAAAQETELAVDPAFLHALASAAPRIAGIETACKRGGFDNELGRFRYDAVLRIGPQAAGGPTPSEDWLEAGLDLDAVRGRLSKGSGPLIVSNVPNARVVAEMRLHGLLLNGSAQQSVATLRRLAEEASAGAIDPEAFYELASGTDYRVRVRPSVTRADRVDAVFWRRAERAPFDAPPAVRDLTPTGRRRYTNDPLASARFRALSITVRDKLAEDLPSHMVPSRFSMHMDLPRTASGKLDRRALAAVEAESAPSDRLYVAPRDPVEAALAILWSEVLDLGKVGIDDDFFTELGGHSLVAVQIVNHVRDALRIDVPLRTLFESPTVRSFAEALQAPAGRDIVEVARVFVSVSTLAHAELEAALEGSTPAAEFTE